MSETYDDLNDEPVELNEPERNERDRRARIQQLIDDTRKRLREGTK